MSIAEFYDYIENLKDECFPLIVEVKDTKGQTRVDVITYDKKDDMYFWADYCDESEEVVCWISAKEAIEHFYSDSYSDS